MSGDSRNWIIGTITVLVALVLGWWIARDVRERTTARHAAKPDRKPVPVARQFDPVNAATKGATRPKRRERLTLEDALLGLPGERIVRFGSDEDYQAFLRRLAGSKARLLGRIDRLRALRVGFDNLDDLYDLLGDDDETYSNFLVAIPDLPQVDAQPGAVGFGATLLDWLGIIGDNSTWGDGVRIAVLDTGISPHSALPDAIPQFDLLQNGEEVPLHGHGNAVTSLIVGDSRLSQGIAPASEVFSIRIGDETGSSNSFLLAEGIFLAVDEGAQILNISMGSYGDSALVREAVLYAAENGVLIVAAAGNEGLDAPAFPAAYDSVLSVGSHDAEGSHLLFSNQGENLSLSAPGLSLPSAWTDEQFVYFTGTSASAPVVTAAIAATASQLGISLEAAAQVVLDTLNEAGAPGPDPAYGGGMIDVGRAISSTTPGIYDVALADNYFSPAPEGETFSQVSVTVQNRGTETVTNLPVEVVLPNGPYQRTIGALQPNDVAVLDFPLLVLPGTESLQIASSVTLPGAVSDADLSNNRRATAITLIPPSPEPDE